jgi:hypothetical protein
MWRKGIIHLIVVALGAYIATAGQPEQAPAGEIAVPSFDEPGGQGLRSAADPNQTWDQAAHLAEEWTSVTQTIRVDRSALTYRYVAAGCAFTILDPNGLLGFASSPVDGVLAVDENARVFYSSHVQSGRSYRAPTYDKKRTADGQYVSEVQPYSFLVTIPLDSKRACPVMISRLEVSTYVLIAGVMKNVDLPFQASQQWVDVVPGLQVLVEKADVTGTRYEYSINVKHSPNQVDVLSLSSLYFQGNPPEVVVAKIDILDAQGQSIPDHSSGIFLNRATYRGRGLGDMTVTGSGDGNLCGGAATIRFVLALDAYEKEIRLVLQNIPVPILW